MKTSLNILNLVFAFFSTAATLATATQALPDTTRIVTLDGSITEMVCALGFQENIVGTDDSSTVPAAMKTLPKVGYVRTVAAEGILSLNPTLIITGDTIAPHSALEQLKSSGIPLIVVPSPSTPEEITATLQELGEKLGRTSQAEHLCRQMTETLQRAMKNTASARPRVAFFMNPTGGTSGMPLAAGKGSKAHTLILTAGGENIFSDFNSYKPVSFEMISALDPEIILVGTQEELTEDLVQSLQANPLLSGTSALRNKNVFALDLGRDLNFGPTFGQTVQKIAKYFQQSQLSAE